MRTSTPANVLAVAIAVSVALPVSLAGIVAPGCAAHADTSTGASADKAADGALSKCKPVPDYLIKKIKIHRQPYRMLVTCRYRLHEMPLLMMPASNELTPLNALLTEISKEFIDTDSKVVVQVEPGGGAVTAAYGCPWESLFCRTLARLQALPASSARDEQLLNFAIACEQHVTRDTMFQADDNKGEPPTLKSGVPPAKGALPAIRALHIYKNLPSMRASLKGKVDFACFKTYEDALAADRAEKNTEANALYAKAVDQALAQCQSKDKDVQALLKYVFEYAGQETYEGYRDFLIRRKDTKAVKALDARVKGKCLAPGESHSLPFYMRSDGLRESRSERNRTEKSQTEKNLRHAFQAGVYCRDKVIPDKIHGSAVITRDPEVSRIFVPLQQSVDFRRGLAQARLKEHQDIASGSNASLDYMRDQGYSRDCPYEQMCWNVLADLGKLPPSASRTAAIASTLDFLNRHLSTSTSGSAACADSTDATDSAASVNSVDEASCFATYIDALAADDAGDIAAAAQLYRKSQVKAVRLQNHQSDLHKEYPAACDYALSEINGGYGDFLLRHYKDLPASARDYPHALKGVSGLYYHPPPPVWTFENKEPMCGYRPTKPSIYDLVESLIFDSKPQRSEHLLSQPDGSASFVPYVRPELPIIFFF